jgi:hypothetical protein
MSFLRIAWLGGGPDPSIALAADTGDDTPIPMDGFVHPVFNLPGGQGTDAGDAQVTATDAEGVYRLRMFLNAAATWTITFTNNDASAHGLVWVVADSDEDSEQPWIHVAVPNAPSAEITFVAVAGDRRKTRDIEISNFGTGPVTVDGFTPAITAPFGASTFPVALGPTRRVRHESG